MRERLSAWLKRTLPRYSWLPLLACLGLNLLVYYGSRLLRMLTGQMWYYDLSLPLDRQLPLVPFFVVFYVLAYVSWYLGYALIARERPENCGVLFGEMIAKLICMVFFIFLPTLMERPEISGTGPFVWMTQLIYRADTPADNLFPSIHCMENWIVWRGMFGCRQLSRGVKTGFLIMALLVFASTLLIRQHVLVDIPAAIVVGEIGLLLSKKLRLGERYAACCRKRRIA